MSDSLAAKFSFTAQKRLRVMRVVGPRIDTVVWFKSHAPTNPFQQLSKDHRIFPYAKLRHFRVEKSHGFAWVRPNALRIQPKISSGIALQDVLASNPTNVMDHSDTDLWHSAPDSARLPQKIMGK
jgi:hypothetical protein